MRTGGATTARLIATLALFVLSATLLCGVVAYVVASNADDQQASERRAALQTGIDDYRAAGGDFVHIDPAIIRSLERAAGLKDLRFETELAVSNRAMLSILDGNGRIVGWFSWEPDRPMTQAMGRLGPLFATIAVCLLAFCILPAWYLRRATRDVAWSEERAATMAHEDVLTGLPNHRRMIELIGAAMAARKPDEVLTLGLANLDGFKNINDTLGRRRGDELLAELGNRLRAAFPRHAAVGRFGGDDFAFMVTGWDAVAALRMMQEATMAVAKPYWIDCNVQISMSAGLSQAPQHGENGDDLIRHADLALQAAKRKGRGSILMFEPVMEADYQERRFIERELRSAMADKTLEVHYQPIVAADGIRIAGFEALLRWKHPERGMIPPNDFVAVAEQTGLMPELGAFVLHRALTDAARWPDVAIAINLSPVQVRDPALAALVSDTMARTGISPRRVILEITEGVLIENPEEAKRRLEELRALGVRLALDDFGTGYSSLSYLQRFPFDKLKIDKSFVDPLGHSPEAGAIIQAIVALGRALGLTIVAEGVETEEQRVLLRLAGCDEMQGYLFAKPASRDSIERLLAEAAGQVA